MLYVTIPTYNRAACLEHTLDRIIPQLTETAQCVVFDNASTDGTPDVAAAAMRRSPFVRSVRNPVNIGGSANFLRCFEVAPEGWIWLLSDDDSPRTDAIEKIEQEIARYPDACYINFATTILDNHKIRRTTTTVTMGIAEFVDALDSFSNLLFITAGVHNLALTRKHLPWTYSDIATHGCQVAITLRTLAAAPATTAVRSQFYIADVAGGMAWDWNTVAVGIYRLLDLIPDLQPRKRFAEKIFRVFTPTPPYGVFRQILSCLRMSDTILHQEITKYSTLAAAIHRYRLRCMFALSCQVLASLGVRRALQTLALIVQNRRGGE